jgi:ketosteroid isomerase-like protein
MNDDLERLNQTWNRAWLENDAARVEKMMAEEYVFITTNGQLWDRQRFSRQFGRQVIGWIAAHALS